MQEQQQNIIVLLSGKMAMNKLPSLFESGNTMAYTINNSGIIVGSAIQKIMNSCMFMEKRNIIDLNIDSTIQ